MQLRDQAVDIAGAIERRSRPRRFEVAPLRQLPGCAAHPIDRSVFPGRPVVSGPHRAAQRPPNTLGRLGKLRLDPAAERFIEEALGLTLGQDGEQRVDVGFDRPFAQQLRTEAMDRADVRFLQPRQRHVQPLFHVPIRPGALPFQRLTQAELQLAGCLLGKGDCDDVSHFGAAG